MRTIITIAAFCCSGMLINGSTYWIAEKVKTNDLVIFGHQFPSEAAFTAWATILFSVTQIYLLSNIIWAFAMKAGMNDWWPDSQYVPLILSSAGFMAGSMVVGYFTRHICPSPAEVAGFILCIIGGVLPQLMHVKWSDIF